MVRAVLLGYGLAGQSFHAPLLAATDGLDVIGILTSNPERQARARHDFPDAVVHSDLDSALDSGADLAIVVGANVAHVPQARAALDAGMHVVVDKPMAPSAEEVRALAAQAAAASRHVIAYQNRRWDSDFLTMLALRDSGRIGDIHRFESRFGQWKPSLSGKWRESLAPEDLGGNLYDLGSHIIDQALVLLGPITTVTAFARSVRSPDIADDDAVVIAHHASGAVSYLVGTNAAAHTAPRMLALGTRGSARIDQMDAQEAFLRAGGRADDPRYGVDEQPLYLVTESGEMTEPLERGRWGDFYAGVRDAVLGRGPSPVPIDETIMTTAVLDAARESSATGRSVQVTSTPTSSS